jgi:RNA polymerase sigma-70 factor (ECF subfamily)
MGAREPEIDEVTLRRAAAGDRRAAGRFVARYQRVVFETAARVLGRGSDDVKDVAQETFMRALPALGTFDPRGSARVSTWVATIAVRIAIDTVRRRRQVVALDDVRANGLVAGGVAADAAIDEGREQVRLADAMERIGAEQRAVIVLRVQEEMSLEEIARALGVEVGTVKSRLSRARDALAAAVAAPVKKEEQHG